MLLRVNLLWVFLIALGTALATGIGALPLVRMRNMSPSWVALANAVAAGSMAGAAAGLFYEGGRIDGLRTIVGAVVGAVVLLLSRFLLGQRGNLHAGNLRGADARKALLVIGVMTLHSFTEGIGVGVSFAGGEGFGFFVALAIAIHNIPEGVAISLALVPNGMSVWQAAAWSVFTSLPQPLMAVPAYLGVRVFEPLLPAGLGFAGGAMLSMVAVFMIPEALETASRRSVAIATFSGAAAMVVVGLLLSL
jgi:zinc transporter ZupT